MLDITISEALSIGNNKLKKITNNYINETFWILSKSIKQKKSELIINKNNLIKTKQFNFFLNLINRRLSHEPLQLILESVPFYRYQFFTQKNVFIVRPETELCIDILKNFNRKFNSTLEVGCGLGCISITLSLEDLSNDILALDINSDAIFASNLNAQKLDCTNVKFINENIFNIKPNKKYDLIISNPPYISLEEIDGLDTEVLLYDPLNALTDYNDGLSFYKYFAEHGRDLLNPKGTMLFEFGGEYQSQKIKKIFSQAGYQYKLFNDLNNEPRFICIRL